jgi:hypothetical protein
MIPSLGAEKAKLVSAAVFIVPPKTATEVADDPKP